MKSLISQNNRIYILPTKYGLLFIITTLIFITVASIYENNTLYILAFWIFSILFVGLFQTHNNLMGIELRSTYIEPMFLSEKGSLKMTLVNNSSSPSKMIEITNHSHSNISISGQIKNLNINENKKISAQVTAFSRGYFFLDSLKISSSYPLGLFKSWKIIKTKIDYYVYPQAKGTQALPQPNLQEGDQFFSLNTGSDFYGHRLFQEGDSPKHIDWKVVARGRPPVIKEFTDGTSSKLIFDWNNIEKKEIEEKLCQLSLWITQAMKNNLSYSLQIPHQKIIHGSGYSHHHQCLKILATFGKS